jgi:hypothetical protein
MVHFITPLYRYNNIRIIYPTIFHQIQNFKWHLIEGSNKIGEESLDFLLKDNRVFYYKMKTNYVWGHEQRNYFIKNIEADDNDWCYFLDDDNVVTSDLASEIIKEYNSDYDIILFSQKQGLTDKNRLVGLIGHLSLGLCDIGSFVIRYGKLKNTIIDLENSRNADGHYCEQIARIKDVKIKYSAEKFVRYNSLSMEIL